MTNTLAKFTPRSGETWRDPFSMYAALRTHDPVHHVEDGDYFVLSRFADVFASARDTTTFSSAEGLTFTYGEMEKVPMDFSPIVMMDPPDHTAFRRLVGRALTPRRVAQFEPEMRSFISDLVEDLNDTSDLIKGLATPLPSFVVAHYLGVPESDRGQFNGWSDAIVAANATGDPQLAADSVLELAGFFAELIEFRRSNPGPDMISDLLAAETESEAVTVGSILGFAFTMVTGGNDTVTGLLGGSAVLLTQNRDQRELLTTQPDLMGNAIEELLRLTSPVQGLARMTTTDVTFETPNGAVTIPKGKKTLLLYASANLDEAEFGPTASELNLARDIDKIMSFSYGAHHCLGASAARLEGRIALEELLARYPNFSVDVDAGRYATGSFVRRHESLPFSIN